MFSELINGNMKKSELNDDMEALTVHPQNREQLKAIKSVLRAMKIPFEKKDSPYNPEFVKMIQEADKERENSTGFESDEDIKKFFEEL